MYLSHPSKRRYQSLYHSSDENFSQSFRRSFEELFDNRLDKQPDRYDRFYEGPDEEEEEGPNLLLDQGLSGPDSDDDLDDLRAEEEDSELRSMGLPVLPVVGLISLLMSTPAVQAVSLKSGELDFNSVGETAFAVPPQGVPASSDTTSARTADRAVPVQASRSSHPLPRASIELDFSLDSPLPQQSPVAAARQPTAVPNRATTAVSTAPSATDLDLLFQGGSFSLVAKAVGAAEGTRTPDGGRTWAYYGHRDPGNGVWNLGSFSYQHGADSPAEADVKQLRRLTGQARRLRQQAERLGVQMSLLEELNGIDLANQSPRAALSRGGYVERLQEAHQQGLQGMDAVIWARTRSFLNPDTGQWNAPGLGNREDSIKADQGRRFREIAQTVAKHQQQQGLIATQPSISPTQMLADVAQAQPLAIPQSELITPQKPPPLPGRETPERLEGLPSVHASSQTAGLGAREVQSSIEAASPKVRSSKNRLAENLPAGNETAGMTVVGRGSIPTWGALPGKIPIEAMTGKVHRFMRTLAVEQSPPGSTRREQILRLQRLSSTVHPTLESEPAQSDRISQSISPQSISPSTVQRDQIETAPVAPETAEENTGLLVETASSGPPRSGLSAATIEHEPKPSAASDQTTPSLREDVAEQIIFQDLPTVAPEN